MKCVVFLVFVATLYVVSANEEFDQTFKEALKTIQNIAKRTADEQETLARREAGIHVNGRCSGLGEDCHVLQHCCGEFICKDKRNWYGMFSGKCINKP